MPNTTTALRCDECGQLIPHDTPGGHCPACLGALAASFPAHEPPLERDDRFEEGAQLGPYRLLRRLGEGGFGYVYLAEQERPIRRQVALKILKPGMDSERIIARFEAERQALALMDHPNISRIIDAGKTPSGRPYFAMELVESGVPITEYCRERKLGREEVLLLFEDVCGAVGHAHRRGIIHRDLKPSNVLVTCLETGEHQAKVIDFGIAKAFEEPLTDDTRFTRDHQLIGTPAYLSPEQAEMRGNAEIDTRADIYSLGVILYELLTGEPPFSQQTLESLSIDKVLDLLREVDPPHPSTLRPNLARELDWITMKALEKDPERRYETADALARDLENHRTNRPVEAGPPGGIYRLRKLVRRHRVGVGAVAAVALALVTGSVVSTVMSFRADRSATAARQAEETGRRTFSHSEFLMAVELLRKEQHALAVAHLARAIRTDPNNQAASDCLVSTLAYENFAVPRLPPLEHPELLRTVAVSEDGSILVTGCKDGIVRVWDLASGELSHELGDPHEPFLQPISIEQEGERLLGAAVNGSARIWDLRTGRMLTPPLQHGAELSSLAWSPDGTRIVTGSLGSTKAKVWEASTGKFLFSVRHAAGISQVSFSPDGTCFATASSDRSARIWNISDGSPVGQPMWHRAGVLRAEFGSDGAKIVTTSYHGQTARVWNAETGEALSASLQHADRVVDLSLSADGTRFVTACDDRIARMWDLESGRLLDAFSHSSRVHRVAFGPGGDWFATTAAFDSPGDVTARIWDVRTAEPLSAEIHHPRGARQLALTPDGATLVTGSRDKTARVWDIRFRAARELRLTHESWVWHAAFSTDDSQIVTWPSGGLPQAWDVSTGAEATLGGDAGRGLHSGYRQGKTYHHWERDNRALLPEPFRSGTVLDFAMDGSAARLVTGTDDGKVRIWSLATEELICPPAHHGAGPVTVVAISNRGDLLCSGGADGTLKVWDLKSGALVAEHAGHEGSVVCARFTPDGSRVVAGAADGSMSVLTLGRDSSRSEVKVIPAHSGGIAQLTMSPVAPHLATGSRDNTARIWNYESLEAVTPPLAHIDHASSWGILVEFTPDGSKLVTAGSHDNAARLWDAETGVELVTPMDSEGVYAMDISPDGGQLVTGSWDGGVRVWDLNTGVLVAPVLRHGHRRREQTDRVVVCSVAFSHDGQRIVSGSLDGTARVWDLPRPEGPLPEWFLKLAEAMAGAKFTERGTFKRIGFEAMQNAREEVLAQPDGGEMVQLGKWLIAEPDQRASSPDAEPPGAGVVDREIGSGSKD